MAVHHLQRPMTPYTIALVGLVTLRACNITEISETKEEVTKVDRLLSSLLPRETSSSVSSRPQHHHHIMDGGLVISLLRQLRLLVNGGLQKRFLDWLRKTINSLDALIDFMANISADTESTSLCDCFLRQVSLHWEHMSFEACGLLWKQLRDEIAVLDDNNDGEYLQEQDFLDTDMLVNNSTKNNESTFFFAESTGVASLPVTNTTGSNNHRLFDQFLDCMTTGERCGAIDSLHSYLDNASGSGAAAALLTQNNGEDVASPPPPQDEMSLLPFAAILLALLYHRQGDMAMARLATQEAVRVAQQCQDPACVAFALGWLEETSGDNEKGGIQAQDLLQQCATRATEQDLRSLVAGARLTLVQRSLNDEVDTNVQAWLQTALTDVPVAADLQALDPPTHLISDGGRSGANNSNSMEEMILRQRLVKAQVHEALDDCGSAALESFVALQQSQQKPESKRSASSRLPSRTWSAVQSIVRSCLMGSVSATLLMADNNNNNNHNDIEILSSCVYAQALSTLRKLQREQHGMLPEWAISFESALILHEWAVYRGDKADTQVLGNVLETSATQPDQRWDAQLQKALRLSRMCDWETALALYKTLSQDAAQRGHKRQQARCLLALATAHLDASDDMSGVVNSLPYLMECLHLSENLDMPGVYSGALISLARVQARLQKVPVATATVRAALTTLRQHGRLDQEARAYLVIAECHLQQAKQHVETCGDNNMTNEASRKLALKHWKKACKELDMSANLYERCHDATMLSKVYYLQARTRHLIGDVPGRDVASHRFLQVQRYQRSQQQRFATTKITVATGDDDILGCIRGEEMTGYCERLTPGVVC